MRNGADGAYVIIWWHGEQIEAVGPFSSRANAELWTTERANRWIVDQDLTYRILRLRKRRAAPPTFR